MGYDDATIRRVQTLLRKERLKRDPEVQCLEDVICLVFLKTTWRRSRRSTTKPKCIDILRKTWTKMSSRGHEVALTLPDVPRGTPTRRASARQHHEVVEAAQRFPLDTGSPVLYKNMA